MSCDEVSELAGLYVLGALETAEMTAVAAHLATCAEAHDEVRELGEVVPALASTIEPIDAPPALKARVLAAVRSEAGAAAGVQGEAAASRSSETKPWTMPLPSTVVPPALRRWSPPAWASWGSAVAALLILAVVGVWGLGALQRADRAELNSHVLADAIAAFSAPGSSTALLRGTGAQAGSSGFAALSADGKGYVVMVGLPSAPEGQAYQAWYIADGPPVSAGLLTFADGYAVLVGPQTLPGAQTVALTLEPAGGSAQPTSAPFVAGEVKPPA
jgi:anti-sigma-K factor RskA